MKTVAIIPARGGSKRIPRKNIKRFRGLPMIGWAINAAKSSGVFDDIIVSTDDPEIADIAQQCGARVPFMRPLALADDNSPTLPVVKHALNAYDREPPEAACCLYPCTPALNPSDLVTARELLRDQAKATIVYPVAEYPHPIQRALSRNTAGIMNFVQSIHAVTRTQDLPRTYHDAGQFYFASVSTWNAVEGLHEGGFGLLIPRWRAIDIDTPDDWATAEIWLEALVQRTRDGGSNDEPADRA